MRGTLHVGPPLSMNGEGEIDRFIEKIGLYMIMKLLVI